ncbi:MAG: hypothetical protein N2C14_16410 [Planctomycetales bacterium]
MDYPLPCRKRLSLLLSLDYLYAEHDHVSQVGIIPPRLLRGTTVLNTGGSFLNLSPGFTVRVTDRLVFLGRVMLPVYQNWNGDRSRNVGQVAPDITTQLTISYLR